MWGALAVLLVPPVSIGVAELSSTSIAPNFDITSLIGTVITPALVIVLLLMGKLHTDPEVKRLQHDNDDLREQIHQKDADVAASQQKLIDSVIPALTRSALVLESVLPLLQTETRVRRLPLPPGDQ
jgi:TRAP-type mannitol/chloroaromatic compound transport system permease large subunit